MLSRKSPSVKRIIEAFDRKKREVVSEYLAVNNNNPGISYSVRRIEFTVFGLYQRERARGDAMNLETINRKAESI